MVLFVGNSLMYFNDLPGTLSRVAALAGDTIRVRAVAEPDFFLIDPALGASNAVDVIKREKWEYVILQQGPTPLQLFRDTLVLAMRVWCSGRPTAPRHHLEMTTRLSV